MEDVAESGAEEGMQTIKSATSANFSRRPAER